MRLPRGLVCLMQRYVIYFQLLTKVVWSHTAFKHPLFTSHVIPRLAGAQTGDLCFRSRLCLHPYKRRNKKEVEIDKKKEEKALTFLQSTSW